MTPIYFSDPSSFRVWLMHNHKTKSEIIVGFYKVKTNKPSLTWSESVDQALCFGWIDGVRRKIDDESYSVRFTPRQKNSTWSAINIKKVEALQKDDLMTEYGMKAFKLRLESNSKIYAHEKEFVILDSKYENLFKESLEAWAFFNNQAPSYKKMIIHWIMSAKQEKTRLSRLAKAMEESKQKIKKYR